MRRSLRWMAGAIVCLAGCKSSVKCTSDELVALDVLPGQAYQVYIADQSALTPPTGVPVMVPWHK